MIYVICGKKRSGKDTVGKILCEEMNACSIAFADHVKVYLELAAMDSKNPVMCDWRPEKSFWQGDRELPLLVNNSDVAQLFKDAIKIMSDTGAIKLSVFEKNKTEEFISNLERDNREIWSIRRLMQVFGTDIVCNLIDDLTWVSIAIKRVMYHANVSGSEHIVITDCRQEHEYKYMSMLGAKFIFVERDDAPKDNHSTEQGLCPGKNDIVLKNNGTLPEFIQLINYTIKECL